MIHSSRLIRALLVTLAFATMPVFAQGVWRLSTETDAMTDKVKRSAATVNDQGHELSIYRGPKDAAWLLFSLGKGSFETLSPKRAPMFRVDKLQPHDLDGARRLAEQGIFDDYRWEPRWINFVIWAGQEVEGRGVLLKELMSGQTVVFRYYLRTGGYKETSFSLDGAAPAIAEALGISITPDPAVSAAADAYRAEYNAALDGCDKQDIARHRACVLRVTACMGKAKRDLKILQECLQ